MRVCGGGGGGRGAGTVWVCGCVAVMERETQEKCVVGVNGKGREPRPARVERPAGQPVGVSLPPPPPVCRTLWSKVHHRHFG